MSVKEKQQKKTKLNEENNHSIQYKVIHSLVVLAV